VELCRAVTKTLLVAVLRDGLDKIVIPAMYEYVYAREGGEWCIGVRP
jgi:hypothetical protein